MRPDRPSGASDARVYREPSCAQGYDDNRYGGRFGSFLRTQEVELFRELIGNSPGLVLDAGAGTGKLTLALLERGCEVASTDFSLEMLRIAKRITTQEVKARAKIATAGRALRTVQPLTN